MTARRTAFVTGAADVLTAFGHLDVLVNNAGVPLTCPAVEVTEAEWNAVIDVNLKGSPDRQRARGRDRQHRLGTRGDLDR